MTTLLNCSFCGKHKSVVKKLIVGDSSAICNDCVELCEALINTDDSESLIIEDLTHSVYPEDIKHYLDEYVIGQDLAKKYISVAVANHYKRINHVRDHISLQKSNVLIVGPTGSGKTLLAKTVAKYLNVPFVIADATSLTEAGYVGDDVESMISRLLSAADGDVSRAEKGIIFIDEIDKIARKSENASTTRDVSGEGVQQALLKLIEGTQCRVTGDGKRKNPAQNMIEVDTSNILFIAGGAFVGLDKIISNRIDGNSIGFSSKIKEKKNSTEHVTPDDLTRFGMIPEFTGRFSNIVSITDLTKEQLIEILTNVKNNIIDQYIYLLSIDDIQLSFTKQAICQIAENCLRLKTGARGLQSEIERILLEIMYNSKRLAGKKIKIDKKHVDDIDNIATDFLGIKK